MIVAGGLLAFQYRNGGGEVLDLTLSILEGRRRGGLAEGDPRARRIEQTNRLIGKLSSADITI